MKRKEKRNKNKKIDGQQDFVQLHQVSRDSNSNQNRHIVQQEHDVNNQHIQHKEQQIHQDLTQEVRPNVRLNQPQPGQQLNNNNINNNNNNNNVNNVNNNNVGQQANQAHAQNHQVSSLKTKILKFIMVALMIVFIGYIGTKFISDNFITSFRIMTMSVTDLSHPPQVMSPQQTDYEAYKEYKNIMQLGKKVTNQKRSATPQQLQQFDDLNFKQFYNLYKVIRTIQLANQYARTQQQKQQTKPIVDPTNTDTPVNKTQYFSDCVDQFQCASCYSFPITATVQYLYKYKYNITVKLSQQQLIDCAHDKPQQNGCEDGNITKGFQYVKNVGLVSTIQYPYRSITGTSFKCDNKTLGENKKYRISGFKTLPPGNCKAIQAQLVKGNVVAAMINAGELPKYVDGTFTDCRRSGLNHAITIVGQTQKNQWIVRNSWGKSWGDNGYFVMGYGNTCGVCSHAIVPVLNIQNGEIKQYNPKDDEQVIDKFDS